MDVQKKPRSEDVVMLDKKKILSSLTKNKNFSINISKPFNDPCIEFLNDFSNSLKNFKEINTYPDLIYLMFWCRSNKIRDLSQDFEDNNLRLGRGLIFHICPSNVPTNFVYSFFFGLLSGNSNHWPWVPSSRIINWEFAVSNKKLSSFADCFDL